MRQYLALQAMESGKSMGGNFLGRGGLMPYGNGSMIMGGDPNGPGKVGKGKSPQCSLFLCLLTAAQSFTIFHADR